MNRLSVLRGLTASLSALLRATAPSGSALTGVDGLDHSRTVAKLALADGWSFQRVHGHASPQNEALAIAVRALDALLISSEHGARPTVALVRARVEGWDALDAGLSEVRRLQDTEPGPADGFRNATPEQIAAHKAFLEAPLPPTA